jgi:hypothetical protein
MKKKINAKNNQAASTPLLAQRAVSSRADIKWLADTLLDIFDRMDYGDIVLYSADKDKKIVDKAIKLKAKYGC